MEDATVEPNKLVPTVTSTPNAEQAQGSVQTSRPASVDKSDLRYPEPRRVRDRDHVRFVTKQPCLICGRRPADPHHLRFTQQRALGRKVSDEFTVPLCRGHHREAHRSGDEAAWWKEAGVDPTVTARALWLEPRIRCQQTADEWAANRPTSLATADNEQQAKRDRPISNPGPE